MEMKTAAKAGLALSALAVAGFIWAKFGADRGGQETKTSGTKQADVATVTDGVLSYCGETIRIGARTQEATYAGQSSSGGIRVSMKERGTREADSASLTIFTASPLSKSCLDEAVKSPIGVALSCDPPDAPGWSDWSKRSWEVLTERPEYGIVVLEGDQAGWLAGGFRFIAAPSLLNRIGEFPFQGKCFSEPGVGSGAERCLVNFRKGRLGVGYNYLTDSIRPWREVDELVRSTLEGKPSTRLCPYEAQRSQVPLS
ncbi:hypothetical protein SN15_04585 [Stenotrophomonas maltophilia]|nr:hypothetical protein SN15_04585 [Stenotrophomonas maltophilia]